MAQNLITCDGEVNWIVESERAVTFSILAMTARTILAVERGKITYLLRFEFDVGRCGLAGQAVATNAEEQAGEA